MLSDNQIINHDGGKHNIKVKGGFSKNPTEILDLCVVMMSNTLPAKTCNEPDKMKFKPTAVNIL